jgi:hypothetical protein
MKPLGVAMLVLLAGLVLVSGCSDGEVRGANKALLEKVSDAQRLLEQAQNLLEAPLIVETETGKTVPLPGVEVDPEEYQARLKGSPTGPTPTAPVEIVLDQQVNPRVEELLNRASTLIEEELQGSQADEATRATARSELARIYEQKGYFLSLASNREQNTAYARVNQAREVLGTLIEQKGILSYYEEVLALEDEDVQSMKSEAAGQARELSSEIDTLTGKIKTLQEKQQALLDRKNTLEAKARSFRAEARAPGKKGYEADIKALEIMDEVGEIDTKISEIDNRISSLQMTLNERRMKLSIAQAQLAAAEKIITGREEGTDPNGMGGRAAVRRQQAKLKQEHQQTIARGKELLQELAGAMEKWGEAEKDAANAYYTAGTNYDRYGQLATSAGDQSERVDAMAQKASILMTSGRDKLAKFYLHSEVEELLERLRDAWPGSAPAEAGAIRKLLVPTADQIRKNGAQDYQDAIDALSDAISRTDSAQRWLYQGAQARAHIGKAQITGDATELKKADTVLQNALEGRAQSPAVAANVGRIKYDLIQVRARLGG